jgi:hypothetical protein
MLAEERAMLSDINLKSGSLSVVRKLGGIQPLDLANRPEALNERMARLTDSIRVHFFSDQLQFPAPQGTPMSATEAQIRYEMLQRLLGPTLGRIQNDLLTPIVSRSFRMLLRDGRIPLPPDIVAETQSDIDIEYLGPLARAQKLDNVVANERFISIAANVSPVFPDAVDVVDIDDVMRNIAGDLGIRATSINDQAETDKVRADRAAKQEAMEQAQIAEQQGKAGQAVNQAQQEAPQ